MQEEPLSVIFITELLPNECICTQATGPNLFDDNRRCQGDPFWFARYKAMLESLKNIEDDWNGMGSAKPNAVAFFNAETILDELYNARLEPSLISASADDGICIIFDRPDKYAAIECYNTGEIVFAASQPSGEPEVWEVKGDIPDIRQSLELLEDYLGG